MTVPRDPRSAADGDAGHRSWLRRWPLALLVLAAFGFLALGFGEARSDAPTFDEPVYVASGLAAVLHQDLAFNAEHPPLPKALAALPALFAHPVVSANESCAGNDERTCSTEFVEAQVAAGKLRDVTFAARIVPLIETVAVALVAYALAAELFGALAGALAGLLWLAAPLVLAIGHLDGTDIPFTLAVMLSSWALARWLRLRTTRALVWTGLALALTASTSISGALVVLVGVGVVVGVHWKTGVRRAFAYGGLVAAIVWAGVWLSYVVLDPSVLTHPTVIAPRPYLDGLSYLASYNTNAIPGYLVGVSYTGSRWWFWPVSLVVKYPAAILLLLVAGLVSWWRLGRAIRQRALLAVALPAIVLAGFTMASSLDVGVRLLLPVMALWTAAAGAIVPALGGLTRTWRRALVPVASLLLVAGAVSTGLSYPHSIASTAPPFTPGYAEATDSNIDWGQGFYALQSWSQGRNPWVAYFGPRGLSVADIPGARPLVGADPSAVTGWVAVSATALTSANRTQLAWLRNYCPVDVLADSILVYRFAEPPVVAPAPARPATQCAGPYSHRADGG
ncbi:MAG TPA: glycosyltransferase family 39 protein [Micromonosporaceae bacterium]|nr:glycosyltransferase family 39 protein [Micromonosporaceae bacterium]